MGKNTNIYIQVEPGLKKSVETLFAELGLSDSQEINLFYKYVEQNKGLPFPLQITNKETIKALEDSNKREGLTNYEDVDDMFKKLGV